MNIVVLGAGAIGSFFGGILSKKNDVVLIGRKQHVQRINENGLEIKGNTRLKKKIKAVESVKEIKTPPDLLLLTVKSFDTLKAMKQAKGIIGPKTSVLSFQNGLNNIYQIKRIIPQYQIIGGVTTHGVQFIKPGVIFHKGKGKTIVGELSKEITKRVTWISSCFKDVGCPVHVSTDIMEDIWKKTIVNASINPLTAICNCPNGYLAVNPILIKMVENICRESTVIAQKEGCPVEFENMMRITEDVINQTKRNFSSMLQSIQQGKKTEINEINGKIVEIGKKYGCNVSLNLLLTKIIKRL